MTPSVTGSSCKFKSVQREGASTRRIACSCAADRFSLDYPTEKLEGEPWSGISLANGDLVNLQIKNAGGANFQYAVLEHEIVLSLGEVNEILQ